jgi:lipopolysaccharide/colanic/teichoic acid biosynthesis glycosyltransferase
LTGPEPPPDGRPTAYPAPSDSLAERYARMAHERLLPRPVDVALRALDLVLATAALLLLSPVIGLVAVAVRITSGTPVFYRGRRVGRAGRVFTMVKVRTLRPDAEARLGPFLGLELTELTQAETTRLGRLLRATHLDELPQLLNVLRGDMSLVGPGMTGLAQLRMTRETSWAEKLAHDLEYIADRSVRLYFRILADTALRLVGRPAPRSSGSSRAATRLLADVRVLRARRARGRR